MRIIREACVETKKEIDSAYAKNAERIELCSHLDHGGYTPTPSLVKYSTSFKNSNVLIMIRRKDDNFVTNKKDMAKLIKDIKAFAKSKIKGYVFGLLTKENKVDVENMKKLMSYVPANKYVVFHMAFDLIEDKKEAIDQLTQLEVRRILTKGGNDIAINNIKSLIALKKYAHEKIELVVGGKVSDDNYLIINKKTGINQFHGRKLAC